MKIHKKLLAFTICLMLICIVSNQQLVYAADTENFVDNNTSNVDGHVGHGTSNNFTAQQDANVAFNDTLTEANTSNSSEVLGYSTATTTGSTTIENQVVGSLFTPTSSAWASQIMAYIACTTATKTSKAAIYKHSDLSLVAQTGEITLAISTAWRTYTFTTYPFLVSGTGYILVAWSYSGSGTCLLYYATGVASQGHIDPNTYGVNFADPMVVSSHNAYKYDINATLIVPNYELDYEFQWTTASFSEINEELCIRTSTLNAEALKVDWWNTTSSAWLNINSSLVASAWNNISISTYLTSATITFRFLGGTESSDSLLSTWIIECNLIHTWSITSFNLNLKVMDYDLVDSISGAIVGMNNGTEYNSTSSANGWANYTGISGNVNIRVAYFNFWVNGTFTVNVVTETTVNIKCNLYDVYVIVKPYNQLGIIKSANVTAFNATSVQANKIGSIVTNSSGISSITNLPNNTLTFTIYNGVGSIVGNSTQTVSSDEYSFTKTADQNYKDTNTSWAWKILIINAISWSFLSLILFGVVYKMYYKHHSYRQKDDITE